MWKGPGQLELGHVGPARLSCAPPLAMVPLPFGESPLLHSVFSRPHSLGLRDGNITPAWPITAPITHALAPESGTGRS